jgi:hypothetical protein
MCVHTHCLPCGPGKLVHCLTTAAQCTTMYFSFLGGVGCPSSQWTAAYICIASNKDASVSRILNVLSKPHATMRCSSFEMSGDRKKAQQRRRARESRPSDNEAREGKKTTKQASTPHPHTARPHATTTHQSRSSCSRETGTLPGGTSPGCSTASRCRQKRTWPGTHQTQGRTWG